MILIDLFREVYTLMNIVIMHKTTSLMIDADRLILMILYVQILNWQLVNWRNTWLDTEVKKIYVSFSAKFHIYIWASWNIAYVLG